MTGEIEDNTLYRFRSMSNLLGEKYQELERQSIFFSPPELLNDPMEGFRDIYFKGDRVLWENLFKHYLASLVHITIDYFTFGESKFLDGLVQIFSPEDTIPENLKDSWGKIQESFFANKDVETLIDNIVKNRNEVFRIELSFYLKLLHPYAIMCILEIFFQKDIIAQEIYATTCISQDKNIGKDFFLILKETPEEQREYKVDLLLNQYQLTSQQTHLIIEHNNRKQEPNKRLLASDFPFVYTLGLEKLMYPNWFTACFMSKATNSSVWGNYGHNHSGACLIFNTNLKDDNNHHLNLNNIIEGYDKDGPIKGHSSLSFYKIRYTHKQKPLNFFESIGQLPIPIINKQWLTKKNGTRSTYISIFNDEWRKNYWDNFYLSITQKNQDWEYENEYRLILNDIGGQYEKSGTTLNYDFKSLKGIIFGINTSDENKLKVLKIIENKVRENDHFDFKFYQAYYCRHTGEIKNTELSMLKFTK